MSTRSATPARAGRASGAGSEAAPAKSPVISRAPGSSAAAMYAAPTPCAVPSSSASRGLVARTCSWITRPCSGDMNGMPATAVATAACSVVALRPLRLLAARLVELGLDLAGAVVAVLVQPLLQERDRLVAPP